MTDDQLHTIIFIMIRKSRNSKFVKSLHLKCLFYYFKLCGLAPVDLSVNAIDNAKVNRWTFSRVWSGIVYNVFLVIATIVWSYLIFYETYFKKKIHFTFDRTVYIIVDGYSVVNTVCIIILFSCRQAKVLVLFNKLNDIRETIKSDCNSTYEYSSLFHKIMTLLVINIPIWVVLIATIFMYEYEDALMFSGLSFCIFVRNALTLQYCICLKLIEHLLNVLNRNLCILSNCLDSSHLEPSIVNAIDKSMSLMWEWYSLLCKSTRDMSNFYSFPMLLNIQCEFLMTITIIYFIMKPIVFELSNLMILDYVNCLCFLLTHLCPMILLTTSVSKVIDESQVTREIINDYVKVANIRSIKEKLLQFSIYLLHNNISFNIYDLFSLDGTLLVMMAGSVATYLVILLQFQPQSTH